MNYFFGKKRNCDDEAVRIFFSLIKKIRKKKIYIGFVGGKSVANFYKKLSKELIKKINEKKEFKEKNFYFYLLDERITKNKKQRNSLLIEKYFGNFKLNNIVLNLFDVDFFLKIDENEKKEYLNKYYNFNFFDFVFLSSGEDGHIASLFPHRKENNSKTKMILIKNAPKLPPVRVSVTFSFLKKTRFCFVFFYKEIKKKALHNFLKQINFNKNPVSFLYDLKNVFVFSDLKLESKAKKKFKK